MITYNPKSWLALIFHLTKSDTLTILWKELIFIFLFTLGIAFFEIHFFSDAVVLEKLFAVYSILGFVLSLLLVFRTNTAYDRWWEGRRKWGELVNDSRNLAVKLTALELPEEDNAYFARHIGNFALCIKEHLREGTKFELLDLTEDEIIFLKKLDHIDHCYFCRIGSFYSCSFLNDTVVPFYCNSIPRCNQYGIVLRTTECQGFIHGFR